MKGRSRRFMAMLLACSMSFGLLFSGNAFAAENDGTETGAIAQAEAADNLDAAADGSLTESDIENISAAAAYIREQMTQRETVITGSFVISDMENMDSVFKTLADQIFICTSESDEGDYLKQHNGGMSWNYEAAFDGSTTTFSYELRTSYYTTLEQEQEVADRIGEVLAELSLDGLSDYEKAKKIYDYIAINVSYDYEHIGDSSYMLSHTAYAALIQETAVCQGYASLFYRMAHEAGLSVRIVTGSVDGEAHAWNMVKIGDLYYYVDTTHASSSGNREDYFLKGSISFADRQLDSDYLSADFTSEFPMSEFDYSDDSGNTEVSSGELTSSIQWCVKSSTDEEGKTTYYLELQGNGEIPDYAQNDELPWEEWRDEITVVTVGSGITKIGSYVFANMDALTTVQIANTVTALGDGVFYNCGKLTNLQIPDSVTSFGNFVIGGTYGKTQWEYNPVEKKLTVTGDGAMGEPYVEGSTTEKNASRVPWNRYRDQIEEVVIEEGVVNLSTYALHGMTNLTAVTLPSTLEEIGEGSFESCTALTYICIPDSVKTIGHYAFRYCEGLRSIHIPASVTSIGVRAFADCPYLHEFYFYGDAPEFENQAIMDSEYITVYYDGSGWSDVKSLFEYLTFETWEPGEYDNSGTNVSDEGIKSQTSGKYGDDIEWNYDEKSAVLTLSGKGEMGDPITIVTVDETTNTTTTSYSTNAVPWNPFNQQIKEVVISDGITSISRYAFWWLSQIESITIPDSVITVGQQSFVHCSKLQTVTFGEDLTTIGKEAFKDCTALKEIYISDKLTSVEESAFTGCETLADVYYEGSENEWEDIVIGEDNDPLINAEIHYNYGNGEENPEEGGDISLTAIIFGQDYSCKEGEAIQITATYISNNEPSDIIWECNEENAITFGESTIQAPSVTGEEDTWRISVLATCIKKGSYDITLSIGDTSGMTSIIVENIISGVCGKELTWTLDEEGTLVISGSGAMQDYDETEEPPWNNITDQQPIYNIIIEEGVTSIGKVAFQSLFEVETVQILGHIEEINECAFDITGSSSNGLKIYFADDAPNVIANNAFGTDSMFSREIYYNPDQQGWNEIISKEYDNHSLAFIYTEDLSEKLKSFNMWSFPNEPRYFGGNENGWYITEEDYNRLLSNLDKSEKKAITNEGFLKEKIFNVDGETGWHAEWEGSCSGMSSIVALIEAGILSSTSFSNATNLSNVPSSAPLPEKIQSAINYYQFQQRLPVFSDIEENFMSKDQVSQLKEMEGLVQAAENNGRVALINFGFLKYENGAYATEPSYHAIIGYAIERGDFSVVINSNTYKFDRRILTYDPRSSGNNQEHYENALYYNETQWAIPFYNAVSTSNSYSSESLDDTALLKSVITDTNYINAIDFVTGKVNCNFEYQNVYLYTIKPSFSITSSSGTEKIENKLFNGVNTVSDNGAVVLGTSFETNDIDANVPYTIALPNISESYRLISDTEAIDYSILYKEHYLSALSEQSGTVTFSPDGKVVLETNEVGANYLSLTANDGYCTLPWNTVEILGNDTQELSAEWTDDGVLVTGDNLENVTIVGSNDDDMQEKTFSTDEDKVLISESNNELTVLIDTNNDGIYDTDVNDDHIHEYGTPEFIWSGDHEACTAVFNCESCDDEQKIECNITSETTDPTCTEDGKTVYTATVSFADKEYTDTQEDVIPATGHTYEYTDNGDGTHTKVCTAGDDTATEPHTYQDGTCTYCGAEEPEEHIHEYGTPEFKWSEDYITCTMVFTCKDGDDQQSIECEVTDEITDATCTENGKAVYTAKGTFDGKEYTDVKEVEIPASGHAYGTPEFNWSEDYQTCTAVFTCESCDNEQKIECDITSETTDSTCTEDGKTVYTATVSFADKEYTDTQEEVISATGHTYEYTDNGDGTHTKVCTAGDDKATEPHTYQDGICTYCGAEEPKEHVHEYGTPEFKWSEDYTTCTMVFTCKDGDDQQSIECEVTDEITDATCTESGKAVYTAKGTFDSKEYTDVKEVEIPASGHAYGTPEFNWSEDYQTCTVVFTCESCDNEQKIECDITSETTEPTCTEDGKTVYTATVSFADKEYTDTQEEVIIATGHSYEYTDNGDGTHTKVCTAGDDTSTEPHTYQDGICTYCGAEEPEDHTHKYGEPKFTWSDDYNSCTATFTCVDGDDRQIVDCAVTAKDNEDGTVSYTAVAEFNGESYTAEQVVDIHDEPDEKPESGKPTESGDNNNSGNSADVNEGSSESKTSEESASNVQTGDDSILVLWSLLIASMISTGVIVLLIRRKYTK